MHADERRGIVVRRLLRDDVEHAHQLRRARGSLRAGAAQDAAEPFQVALVPFDELDLDLDEMRGRPACVEDVDDVERHVGERAHAVCDADAVTTRPQGRDRLDRAVPQVRGQQLAQVVGGPTGPPNASISARA